MNPAEWIMRAARVTPDAPALFRGEALVADYAGFARATAGVAAGLRGAHGLERGERVAIFMTNRTEYLEALYGVWHAGLVAVPINAKLHPKEAGFILRDSDAKLVLASEDVGTPLAALGLADIEIVMVGTPFDRLKAAAPMPAPASIGADDLIWLFYTSGTTGRPKGVMLSAGNLAAMAFGYLADVSPVERRDATLYAAPMSHGAGLYSLMFAIAGARHVCPESGGFEPTEIAGLAPKIGRVSMFAAPTMIHRLVAHMRKTGGTGEGIDTIVYGGRCTWPISSMRLRSWATGSCRSTGRANARWRSRFCRGRSCLTALTPNGGRGRVRSATRRRFRGSGSSALTDGSCRPARSVRSRSPVLPS